MNVRLQASDGSLVAVVNIPNPPDSPEFIIHKGKLYAQEFQYGHPLVVYIEVTDVLTVD